LDSAERPVRHGRVEALDLLRLLAAVSVVIYHYTYRGTAADGFTNLSLPALNPVTRYAYMGVELFFVISGFVIAYSAEGRTAREFVIARASRIYPGFLVCMTITFAVTLAIGAPRFETSVTQWIANLVILSPALKQPFMDGVYWSIVYELIFYAWIFVLIVLGLFARRLTIVVAAWLAISAINELLIGSGLLRHLFITDDSGFFCAGLMMYVLYSRRSDRFTWPLLGIATLVAAGQSIINAGWIRGHFAEEFSSPVIGAVSVGIIALVGVSLLPRRLPIPARLIVALGGLTYPLYLLHQQAGFIIFNRLEGHAPPVIVIAGTLMAMLLISFLVWRFAERPGQRVMRSFLSSVMVWPLVRPSLRKVRRSAASITENKSLAAVQPPMAIFGPVTLPRAARL